MSEDEANTVDASNGDAASMGEAVGKLTVFIVAHFALVKRVKELESRVDVLEQEQHDWHSTLARALAEKEKT